MMWYHTPGELSILLATGLSLVAGIAFFLSGRGNLKYEKLAKRSYNLFTLTVVFAVAYLFYLFFSHNYAFKYVYDYSSRTQPFLYILSGFWGGQEGTYLLWLFFNALFGYLILKKAGQYRHYAMSIICLTNLFFLAIMIKLSPFALLPGIPADGMGLNPLLRDPWMAIHPPTMFAGYSMALLPFSIAMAALLRHDYSGWVRKAFPWAAISAFLLAAGNILGGYWAYKTLGWGGFWAWDPVENSSFVPWVISLALLHGLIVEKRTNALRRTNILMSSFLFLLVVYGTFLTRSGVLSDFSVHSFTDLGINGYLVTFMVVFTSIALGLFAYRTMRIESTPLNYNIIGREFSLFAALVVLFLFGTIVIFWSSLPILSSWFSDNPRAANISTYNSFAIPLSILMAFLLTVSPALGFMKQRISISGKTAIIVFGSVGILSAVFFGMRSSGGAVEVIMFTIVFGGITLYLTRSDLRKNLLPGLLAFVAVGIASYLLDVREPMMLLFLATAGMASMMNLIKIFSYLPGRWQYLGGELTHFGFGLMLIGILASSAFDSSDKLAIPLGESRTSDLFGVTVSYEGMEHEIEYPNNELILLLSDGSYIEEARPQLYYSERMNGIMRKPFIHRNIFSDMYYAPEQIQSNGEEKSLTLTKGEAQELGGYKFQFEGFDLGGQHEGGSGMKVAAEITVWDDSNKTTIYPSMIHDQDQYGKAVVSYEPIELAIGNDKIEVHLDQVLADQGMVVLGIPRLFGEQPVERLILDITKKPLISLVWIGTTLIMLGLLLVFRRRREEMIERSSVKAKSSSPDGRDESKVTATISS